MARTLKCKLLSRGYGKMAALKWTFFFFTFVLHDFLQSPEHNPGLWQLQATVWGTDEFILQNICSIVISSQRSLWARGRGKWSICFPRDVTVQSLCISNLVKLTVTPKTFLFSQLKFESVPSFSGSYRLFCSLLFVVVWVFFNLLPLDN